MRLELLRKYLYSQPFQQQLSRRLEKLQEAETNPVTRVEILTNCQNDFFYFVSMFGIVYEPRLSESPDIPYFPFEYQKMAISRVIQAEIKSEDLFIEKTRDMGITWTMVWYILWKWLFGDKWYCLMGSRKEDEVDDGSPQSLFGKLRYALYSLPVWMRPDGFKKSQHDLRMKLVNPDKQNFVEGESANVSFGRGGRYSMMLLDELFFWRFARESWRSTTDSSPVRIAVSTAVASSFARSLSNSFKEQGKCVTLGWEMHPFKDMEWYKEEEKRRAADPLSVAAELNMSYASDPTLAYYPEVMLCQVAKIPYNPGLPLYIGCDFGGQDHTAFVYLQRDVKGFYVIDGITARNKPLHWYYPFLKPGLDVTKLDTIEVQNKFSKEKFTLRLKDYTQPERDLIARFNTWRNPVMYCGEVAHRQRMMKSMTSIAQELAGVGIMLRVNELAVSHVTRRTAVKKMLGTTKFNDGNGALDVYDALANSRYPAGRDNSTSDKYRDSPVHDPEIADIRSAVENAAVNLIDTRAGGIKSFPYIKI